MKKFLFLSFLQCIWLAFEAPAQTANRISIEESANTYSLKGNTDDMNFKRLKRLEGTYQLIVDDVKLVEIPVDLGLKITQLQQPEHDVTVKINNHLMVKIISLNNIQLHHKIAPSQTIILNKETFPKQ
ncbi:MAG: hypothetical protein U0T32_14385 [Chitinophagales bacterium]|jgi:hypothetical protein